MPPASENPTVLIGSIGVNVKDMKPIIVVMADRKTARPVEFRAMAIFSLGVPIASAYLLVM